MTPHDGGHLFVSVASNLLAVSADALLFSVLALCVMPCGKAAAKASASQPGGASPGARAPEPLNRSISKRQWEASVMNGRYALHAPYEESNA